MMAVDVVRLITRIVIGAILVCVVGVLLAAEIPMLPTAPESSSRQQLLTIFPQGWAFFTRNPQEPQFRIWRVVGASKARLQLRNAASAHLFGFRREGRMRAIEFGAIVTELPRNSWYNCRSGSLECLDSAILVTVTNRFPAPSICGLVSIDQRPPVPWAWSKIEPQPVMGSRAARVNVVCSGR